jgi:hypothetical protein
MCMCLLINNEQLELIDFTFRFKQPIAKLKTVTWTSSNSRWRNNWLFFWMIGRFWFQLEEKFLTRALWSILRILQNNEEVKTRVRFLIQNYNLVDIFEGKFVFKFIFGFPALKEHNTINFSQVDKMELTLGRMQTQMQTLTKCQKMFHCKLNIFNNDYFLHYFNSSDGRRRQITSVRDLIKPSILLLQHPCKSVFTSWRGISMWKIVSHPKVSWAAARDFCQQRGMEMPMLKDVDDMRTVIRHLKSRGFSKKT